MKPTHLRFAFSVFNNCLKDKAFTPHLIMFAIIGLLSIFKSTFMQLRYMRTMMTMVMMMMVVVVVEWRKD